MADFVESHKWVVIATTRASQDRQMKYGQLREALVKKMTAAQIAEAEDRAGEWLSSFARKKP